MGYQHGQQAGDFIRKYLADREEHRSPAPNCRNART